VDQARRGAHRVQQVSAGAARLLAIDHVVSSYPDELGPPDTEVIEERSSYEPLVTLSYAAEDPWIVVLISASLRFRYIIVVMPDGAIADARRARIGKLERLRGLRVQIPGGTDAERNAARRRPNAGSSS
jgi:hypothetical protein